ncbi:MAG: ASCH domain-containing protein [Acidobacteriota bacterium]
MLLFKKPFHAGLVDGSIRLTFRRWDKPHVRAGGRYRCHPIGVLEVDDVRLVPVRDITDADAQLAGFAARGELVEYLRSGPHAGGLDDATELYRVELHHGGDGDRVEIALDARLTRDDVAAIAAKLAKLDARAPWTRKTLALIDKHPRVAASKLAAKLGRDTLPFKVDVRKLKKLGLTQSFEVGYELSPRGRAYLAARRRGW